MYNNQTLNKIFQDIILSLLATQDTRFRSVNADRIWAVSAIASTGFPRIVHATVSAIISDL